MTNVSGKTTLHTDLILFTLQPQATLDVGRLKDRATYAVQITAQNGFPKARVGDFKKVVYPYARSQVTSALFRVVGK